MQVSKHVSFPCKCPQARIALHSSRVSAAALSLGHHSEDKHKAAWQCSILLCFRTFPECHVAWLEVCKDCISFMVYNNSVLSGNFFP